MPPSIQLFAQEEPRMAALLTTLLAGMAVGIGPDPMSQATEQRFPHGRWEGSFPTGNGLITIRLVGREVDLRQRLISIGCRLLDEGKGKCQMPMHGKPFLWGIYKCEGGCLILCMREPKDGPRPTMFGTDGRAILFTLKPNKPKK
jgi:hypothetical protein